MFICYIICTARVYVSGTYRDGVAGRGVRAVLRPALYPHVAAHAVAAALGTIPDPATGAQGT